MADRKSEFISLEEMIRECKALGIPLAALEKAIHGGKIGKPYWGVPEKRTKTPPRGKN